jgi:DNA repair ATPase RecN
MRYRDMEKIIPAVQEGELRDRLQMKKLQEIKKLQQSLPLYNEFMKEEMNNFSSVEELKGSLAQIDDKFDRLIQQVEDCNKLTESIHQKVKDIIWGIEASKNEE